MNPSRWLTLILLLASPAAAQEERAIQGPKPPLGHWHHGDFFHGRFHVLKEVPSLPCYILPAFPEEIIPEDFERVTSPGGRDTISYTYGYQQKIEYVIFFEDPLKNTVQKDTYSVTKELSESFSVKEPGTEYSVGVQVKRFIRQKGHMACKN